MLSNQLKRLVNQKSHALALLHEIKVRERLLHEIDEARRKGESNDALQRRIEGFAG